MNFAGSGPKRGLVEQAIGLPLSIQPEKEMTRTLALAPAVGNRAEGEVLKTRSSRAQPVDETLGRRKLS
jgi:hypothetical protein